MLKIRRLKGFDVPQGERLSTAQVLIRKRSYWSIFGAGFDDLLNIVLYISEIR